MKMQSKQLLVCDLDNTLYDWVAYFVPSFYAMVDAAVDIMGCDREELLDDLRTVHQTHADSEHPFALLETQMVRKHYAGLSLQDTANELDGAFYAFNSMRKRMLRLNPGVQETLTTLREKRVVLVAHTESKLFSAYDRLSRLGILGYFRQIYCRERSRSVHPNEATSSKWLERIPMQIVTELPRSEVKPDPLVLKKICSLEGVSTHDTAYVGDSVARDVLMARRANVYSIWAKYGTLHDPALYDALVRVSHWTKTDVARERQFNAEAEMEKPDFTASTSFAEIPSAIGIV
jgi:FMN phosphatase YigB (HAD superfamily)